MILESKSVDDEEYIQNLEKQNQLSFYLKMYKKMELNLETIFQLTGKLILIALLGLYLNDTRSSVNAQTAGTPKTPFSK